MLLSPRGCRCRVRRGRRDTRRPSAPSPRRRGNPRRAAAPFRSTRGPWAGGAEHPFQLFVEIASHVGVQVGGSGWICCYPVVCYNNSRFAGRLEWVAGKRASNIPSHDRGRGAFVNTSTSCGFFHEPFERKDQPSNIDRWFCASGGIGRVRFAAGPAVCRAAVAVVQDWCLRLVAGEVVRPGRLRPRQADRAGRRTGEHGRRGRRHATPPARSAEEIPRRG